LSEKYRYRRICDLGGCEKEFETNYKQQRFCEKAHHDEHWKRIRSGKSEVTKELSSLRKKVEALEKKDEK